MKRVLMIAYHFPPLSVSSGLQRTLRFAQYLPQFGWEPVVLTADPRSYTDVAPSGLADLPPGLVVRRAFALDAAKHLAIKGRYPRVLGLPDRWWTWRLGAVPAGLGLIARMRPALLWSTYPIATAHAIGHTLHRLSGIPWVADFRDPMVDPDFPTEPRQRRAFERIERKAVSCCRQAVFTAPGMLSLYRERYPQVPESRFALIENGYEESAFAEAERISRPEPPRGRPAVLVHSGTIYPFERDPTAFLAALGELRRSGSIAPGRLAIVLRASGCDDYLRGLIRREGIEDVVRLEPSIPYRAALAEMISADGVVLLQAATCNYQVPAKLYEYLRARRPILALTDPRGDTAAILRSAGVDTIAPLDSKDAIARLLQRFLRMLDERSVPLPREENVASASRQGRALELSRVLDAIAA